MILKYLGSQQDTSLTLQGRLQGHLSIGRRKKRYSCVFRTGISRRPRSRFVRACPYNGRKRGRQKNCNKPSIPLALWALRRLRPQFSIGRRGPDSGKWQRGSRSAGAAVRGRRCPPRCWRRGGSRPLFQGACNRLAHGGGCAGQTAGTRRSFAGAAASRTRPGDLSGLWLYISGGGSCGGLSVQSGGTALPGGRASGSFAAAPLLGPVDAETRGIDPEGQGGDLPRDELKSIRNDRL